jgi:uracil phosphoribosyltransferase
MLGGILELITTVRVGFFGLYRDEDTKEPVATLCILLDLLA